MGVPGDPHGGGGELSEADVERGDGEEAAVVREGPDRARGGVGVRAGGGRRDGQALKQRERERERDGH